MGMAYALAVYRLFTAQQPSGPTDHLSSDRWPKNFTAASLQTESAQLCHLDQRQEDNHDLLVGECFKLLK